MTGCDKINDGDASRPCRFSARLRWRTEIESMPSSNMLSSGLTFWCSPTAFMVRRASISLSPTAPDRSSWRSCSSVALVELVSPSCVRSLKSRRSCLTSALLFAERGMKGSLST